MAEGAGAFLRAGRRIAGRWALGVAWARWTVGRERRRAQVPGRGARVRRLRVGAAGIPAAALAWF